MDFVAETVLEVVSEFFSEGTDAAITGWVEKKRKKEENKDVSEEPDY